MNKSLIIGLAVMGIVAAFLLIKRPERDVGSFAVTAADSAPVQSSVSKEPHSAENRQSIERLPLPTPKVPRVAPEWVPIHLHPLFGWKEIGGYVPRRRLRTAATEALKRLNYGTH